MSASGGRARHRGDDGVDAEARPVQVRRAVVALKRATSALINLLKSPDEAVRAGAADALRGLDPPPVWDLIEVLIKARDTRFRVEIIRVLGGLGAGYRIHVTLALAQLWQGGDPAIRQAIVEAALSMRPASLD